MPGGLPYGHNLEGQIPLLGIIFLLKNLFEFRIFFLDRAVESVKTHKKTFKEAGLALGLYRYFVQSNLASKLAG
jgi:hypothetical protein